MSFSAGVFSINSSGQPVVAGTSISAATFNALTSDLATGLSTCMLKDGTQTATAGIGFFAGTVLLPGIYFGTDTATGFYRIGLNNTGFSINATKLLDLSSTGISVIGTIFGGTARTTSYVFESTAAATIAGYVVRSTGATAGHYRKFGVDNTNAGLFYDHNDVGMYMAEGATVWTANSDASIKTITGEFSGALSHVVNSVRTVRGYFTADENKKMHSWLIAQDWQDYLPEAVTEREGVLGLAYEATIPVAFRALKEEYDERVMGWQSHDTRLARLEAALSLQ